MLAANNQSLDDNTEDKCLKVASPGVYRTSIDTAGESVRPYSKLGWRTDTQHCGSAPYLPSETSECKYASVGSWLSTVSPMTRISKGEKELPCTKPRKLTYDHAANLYPLIFRQHDRSRAHCGQRQS